MNDVNFFKDLFESTEGYRKLVSLMFLIKNDVGLLHECWFLKYDIECLCLEFNKILMEQNEEYLDYNKNEEVAIGERILNRSRDAYFDTMFEDDRHEQLPISCFFVTNRSRHKKTIQIYRSWYKFFKKICSPKITQTEITKRICRYNISRIYFFCLINEVSKFKKRKSCLVKSSNLWWWN